MCDKGVCGLQPTTVCCKPYIKVKWFVHKEFISQSLDANCVGPLPSDQKDGLCPNNTILWDHTKPRLILTKQLNTSIVSIKVYFMPLPYHKETCISADILVAIFPTDCLYKYATSHQAKFMNILEQILLLDAVSSPGPAQTHADSLQQLIYNHIQTSASWCHPFNCKQPHSPLNTFEMLTVCAPSFLLLSLLIKSELF